MEIKVVDFFHSELLHACSFVFSRIKDTNYVICTFTKRAEKIVFFRLEKLAYSRLQGENSKKKSVEELAFELVRESGCRCVYLMDNHSSSDEEESKVQGLNFQTQNRVSVMTPFYVISNGGQYIMLFKFIHKMQKYYYAFNANTKKLHYLELSRVTMHRMDGYDFERAFYIPRTAEQAHEFKGEMIKLIFRNQESLKAPFDNQIHQVKDKIQLKNRTVYYFGGIY